MIMYRLDVSCSNCHQGYVGRNNKIVQEEIDARIFTETEISNGYPTYQGCEVTRHIIGDMDMENNLRLWGINK